MASQCFRSYGPCIQPPAPPPSPPSLSPVTDTASSLQAPSPSPPETLTPSPACTIRSTPSPSKAAVYSLTNAPTPPPSLAKVKTRPTVFDEPQTSLFSSGTALTLYPSLTKAQTPHPSPEPPQTSVLSLTKAETAPLSQAEAETSPVSPIEAQAPPVSPGKTKTLTALAYGQIPPPKHRPAFLPSLPRHQAPQSLQPRTLRSRLSSTKFRTSQPSAVNTPPFTPSNSPSPPPSPPPAVSPSNLHPRHSHSAGNPRSLCSDCWAISVLNFFDSVHPTQSHRPPHGPRGQDSSDHNVKRQASKDSCPQRRPIPAKARPVRSSGERFVEYETVIKLPAASRSQTFADYPETLVPLPKLPFFLPSFNTLKPTPRLKNLVKKVSATNVTLGVARRPAWSTCSIPPKPPRGSPPAPSKRHKRRIKQSAFMKTPYLGLL